MKNGVLKEYYAYRGIIPKDTWVEFINDGGTTKVRPCTSFRPNGLVSEVCTASELGKVWAYGSN